MSDPRAGGTAGASPPVAAVILAGGRSRRMGTDKALLQVGGMPLVARVATEARRVTDEVWLSTNAPDRYRFLGLPIVADRLLDRGPLAGLEAGLAATRRSAVLLLACDLPHLDAAWLSAVVDRLEGWDAVIPVTSDGRAHPLAAVYHRSCQPALERQLAAGVNRMTALFEGTGLRVRWVRGAECGFQDRDLTNLNSPADLTEALSISGS